jgi:Ca2+-binding EF-hand superfamily protein
VAETHVLAENDLIKFSEFVQLLKIQESDESYTLFKFFDETSQNLIDLKEYLVHALFLIKIEKPKIELIKVLLMVTWLSYC